MMATSARSLKLSVGREGKNLSEDVKLVQQLLNMALKREPKFQTTGIKQLVEDGDCGPLTINAIQVYQEKVMGWSGNAVDATVSPNKATWKSLNGNVDSTRQIRKQKVTTPPETVAGYKAFKQGDPQWRSEKLGEGSLSIWGFGCALCTLTMAATVIGSPTKYWPADLLPRDLTPPKANDIITKSGGFSNSSLYMSKAAEALGMSYNEFGRTRDTKPEDVSIISDAIASGYPVAANVDYHNSKEGDHWILIVKKYSGSIFGAIDPSYGSEVMLTGSPVSTKDGPQFTRTENIKRGVLYGLNMGGTKDQQQYVVVRFAVLEPAFGNMCGSNIEN
jgi:hypothetical protein